MMIDRQAFYLFSFLRIPFAVSTACIKSSVGKRTQCNLDGSVFLKTCKTCGSPYPNNNATCLIHVTYVSNVSEFSSKWNDLHA